MRRTNTGALRRFPTGHTGGGEKHVERHREAVDVAPRTLARITVIPVMMSRSHSGADAEQLIGNSAFLRAAPAIDVPSVGKRTLGESEADVLLLDARHSRPSVVYRAIV